jgi:hypothetical protein
MEIFFLFCMFVYISAPTMNLSAPSDMRAICIHFSGAGGRPSVGDFAFLFQQFERNSNRNESWGLS